jgi:hypothetical protein
MGHCGTEISNSFICSKFGTLLLKVWKVRYSKMDVNIQISCQLRLTSKAVIQNRGSRNPRDTRRVSRTSARVRGGTSCFDVHAYMCLY